MNDDCRTLVAGLLLGSPWEGKFDMARRVYLPRGVAPACYCYGGGNTQPKILTEYE